MFDVNNCVSFLTNQGGKSLSESMNRYFEASGGSIHRVAWTALYYIQAEPGITQKELASRLMIAEPTLYALVNRMVRDGLISRELDAQNRKYRHLYLEEKGMEEYRNMLGVVEEFNAQATKGISDGELETFKSVMARMIENVNRPLA